MLPHSLTEEVTHLADMRAKRQIGFAWLGALAVGAVVAMLGAGSGPLPPPPAVAVTRKPVVAAPAPAAPVPEPVVMATLEEEDAQRQEVVRTISALPGIDRALWSTRSTLLVHLADEGQDRLTEICATLVRYDGLRSFARAVAAAAGQHGTRAFQAVPDVLSPAAGRARHLQASGANDSRYQCTPRISEANAICSLLGSVSPFSAFLSPLAAAESGNSSNAVFITTS